MKLGTGNAELGIELTAGLCLSLGPCGVAALWNRFCMSGASNLPHAAIGGSVAS